MLILEEISKKNENGSWGLTNHIDAKPKTSHQWWLPLRFSPVSYATNYLLSGKTTVQSMLAVEFQDFFVKLRVVLGRLRNHFPARLLPR